MGGALGPLPLYIAQDVALDMSQKFTVVAIPVLFGALLRILLGMLSDHLGRERTGLLAQVVVMATLACTNIKAVLRDRDTWWFMFFCLATCGSFAGLGNALPLYLTTWYHVSRVAAGLMVALMVFAGSIFRPVSGIRSL